MQDFRLILEQQKKIVWHKGRSGRAPGPKAVPFHSLFKDVYLVLKKVFFPSVKMIDQKNLKQLPSNNNQAISILNLLGPPPHSPLQLHNVPHTYPPLPAPTPSSCIARGNFFLRVRETINEL